MRQLRIAAIRDVSGTGRCSLTAYISHWAELSLQFNAIYSGFLGSAKQIDIVSLFCDQFARDGQLVIVDPVMADGGVAYSTCTEEMQAKMANLVRKASVITPNLSEAYLLLGRPYSRDLQSHVRIRDN